MKRLLVSLFLLVHTVAALAGTLVAGEPGSFAYTDTGYFADRPLTVHYYKARSAGPDARVIIVIHGSERSGKRMRDNWRPFAEKNQLVVLAPEFDKAAFSERMFNMGNMEERDPARWSFGIVERLFERVRTEDQLTASSYVLFGHSAGGQFVHRFMLMTEAPKVSVAVAANAGAYTLPIYPSWMDDRFPYALDGSVVGPDKLRQVFARQLVVFLGEDDTDTNSENLPKTRQAKAQGANRFARGQKFFAQATAQSQKLGVPLAWKLVTVPGVGHSSREMSKAASRFLFESAK